MRGRVRPLRWGPVLLLAAVAVAALLPVASGHANLLSSSPTQGTHLDHAPSRVSVSFTETIDPKGTRLQVLNGADQRVDVGDLQFTKEPPTISVAMPATLPDGAYRLDWTALSTADGHPTEGTVGFAIGGFAAPAPTSGAAVPVSSALARAITYAGFSLAFGAAAFLLWMSPAGYPAQTARIALLVGATLHAAGTVILVANTSTASGIGLGQLASSEVGRILLLRLGLAAAAWLLGLIWTFRPVEGGPFIVTALLVGSALGSARLGHPYMQGVAAMGLDFLHLMAAATWVGGLALLLYLVWQAERRADFPVAELRRVGIRFGTLALVCVVVLAMSGFIIAVAVLKVDILTHPWTLLNSPYGLFLFGKIVLAGVMVFVAAVNRYVLLEGPAERGLAAGLQKVAHKASRGRIQPGLAAGRFRRTLVAEATMGAIVLVLAGLLTSVSPPAAAGPAPLVVDGQGTFYLVQAQFTPPPRVNASAASAIQLTITPVAAEDHPVVNNTCGGAVCVTLEIDYGTGAPERHVAYASAGSWLVQDIVWGRAGAVAATVVIATQDHFQDRVPLSFTVLP